jgi:hypothetical protein
MVNVLLVLPTLAQEGQLFKKVAVDYRNAELGEVLRDLGDKAGVQFNCDRKLIENADRVNYSAKDQEAGRIATRILRPRGLKLEKAEGNLVAVAQLDTLDEFKVKSDGSSEFAEKPKVVRDGKLVTVSFETRGFCDVTVAVENANGDIVRHLACGVLGDNAPEPFQWNSKKQTLTWDSKNDKGDYLDENQTVALRVSLGLKPAYEKPLFWSPYKRFGSNAPIMCATPEGVYVSEGYTVDTVRLFDHDGNYVRTIYPFPAGKLEQVAGLEKQTVLQTGQALPHKLGGQQATLLTSGNSALSTLTFGGGIAATTMAVKGERIALAFLNLNRLRTDGTSGGLSLKGPATGFVIPRGSLPYQENAMDLGPTSAAFSPDGKTVYLTGYVMFNWQGYSRQGVYKFDYVADQAPQVFAGDMEPNGHGDDNAHFAIPNSVACDGKGRVYVADYLNNRIQIFDSNGKYLKTITTPYPAKVQIDPKTEEIYAYSWSIGTGISNELIRKYKIEEDTFRKVQPTLTRFAPFDDPKQLGKFELPIQAVAMGGQQSWTGQLLHVEMDFWAKQPTLWMVGRKYQVNAAQIGHSGPGAFKGAAADDAVNSGIQLMVQDGDKWKRTRSFGEQAQKAVARLKPPDFGIQRLSANAKTHKLYILEHISFNKSHHSLIEIDPQTDEIKQVPMPFCAEDICFDPDGNIYLRTDKEVVRYDPQTWREIPWDYGEERDKVTFDNAPNANVLSALPLPGHRPIMFHQSGMWVSAQGHLAVACNNPVGAVEKHADAWSGVVSVAENSVKYQPEIYPGRALQQPNAEIHIWDKRGKLVRADAVPGLGYCNGLGIDKDDNIYVLLDSKRQLGDKTYPNNGAGTLIKFRPPAEPGSVRILSSNALPIPLPKDQVPKRAPDTSGGNFVHGSLWMSGSEWFYGAAGNMSIGCTCYHTRFCLDTFARSFVPEADLYSVAVLDSNGNLIVRIGKYGSTDDGVPLVPQPGATATHSIGGDEVPLFYPAYVATDTDRRLFISDLANARIVSVKLAYHTAESVPVNAGK